MKITGELLKAERLKKNLTVQDIAFALKLSPKIITSIEAGEIENLPAKTFIRGFVKSYAQFLKIDTDQVMRQFQEEMGSTHPMPKTPITSQATDAPIKASSISEQPKKAAAATSEQTKVLNPSKNNRTLVYIGIAVVLVIAIVGVNRFLDRYQKEKMIDPQDISRVKPLDPNQSQVATTTPEALNSSEQLAATSSGSSAAVLKPSQPLQSPVSGTTTPQQTSTTEIDDGFEPSSGKPIEIIIEARKDTEIMYARGNTKNFSKLKLVAKQIQVIRSTSGLHLKSEDGGSFHVVVNGIDKGAAGPGNKPVRLSF